ncbi:hypothetical protein F4802DRAFT_601401 [Xylaria palmicola]|nr:hypothetical protein F4802DRAFT_601401 [Xylaria palmicola]
MDIWIRTDGQTEDRASRWFPTVFMNLEVKSALLEEGTEWLNVCAASKRTKGDRVGIEVLVRDAAG